MILQRFSDLHVAIDTDDAEMKQRCGTEHDVERDPELAENGAEHGVVDELRGEGIRHDENADTEISDPSLLSETSVSQVVQDTTTTQPETDRLSPQPLDLKKGMV